LKILFAIVLVLAADMKQLYIIKAGTTRKSILRNYGDFGDWIRMCLSGSGLPVSVVDAVVGETLPEPFACCGAIITGSHAMVTDNLPWSLAIEAWIPQFVESGVPLLGICYGHQLLGRALGGAVGYNPNGREIGTVRISLKPEAADDRLLRGVAPVFYAHTIHEQSVLELPPGAVCLASNGHERHHVIRVGACAWGVQFHPEYTLPVMQEYIRVEGGFSDEQFDMLPEVHEAPESAGILAEFACIAAQNR